MSLCFCIQILNVITAGGFVIDYILKVFLLCLHPPYSPAVTKGRLHIYILLHLELKRHNIDLLSKETAGGLIVCDKHSAGGSQPCSIHCKRGCQDTHEM